MWAVGNYRRLWNKSDCALTTPHIERFDFFFEEKKLQKMKNSHASEIKMSEIIFVMVYELQAL